MRAHHDRGAALAHLAQDVLDQPCIDWVEPVKGLVDDQQVGLVQQRYAKLHLLLHALGKLLDLLLGDLGQPDTLQVRLRAAPRLTPVDALERREIGQTLLDADILVQPALFGQIADAAFGLLRQRSAKDGDRAAVGPEQVQDHADRGGLARAVWSEQSKDLAAPQLE